MQRTSWYCSDIRHAPYAAEHNCSTVLQSVCVTWRVLFTCTFLDEHLTNTLRLLSPTQVLRCSCCQHLSGTGASGLNPRCSVVVASICCSRTEFSLIRLDLWPLHPTVASTFCLCGLCSKQTGHISQATNAGQVTVLLQAIAWPRSMLTDMR